LEPSASCTSKDGKRIGLNKNRWFHIVESHNYMVGLQQLVLETVTNPDYIVRGRGKEKLAVKFFRATPIGAKYVVAVYVEDDHDGFIVTAFMTSELEKVLKRGVLWRRP